MRTSTLPLVALLTWLAACTGNGPREPAPEPSPPASTVEPSVPPATQAPTASAPTQAPTASAPTQAPTASAPTQAPTTTPGPGEDALLGTWRSAACAPRKYERVLSFAKGGSFAAEDRVSPCPPRVACIWSGIIHRKGAFKRSGDALSLSVAEASQGPGGQPFPTTLTIDASGAPAETGADGKPCSYQR
ncbi:hypothetical protein WME89_15000 [Sorangium sp. So ce321]|uniref:hypothetical protein n=1 Tax=Sorangium sp. So ce321 TaxID=3133300 RepID=UPI003F5F9024